jgi:hypothetical protein
MTQEISGTLTPFEAVHQRAEQFGENSALASMWTMTMEKLIKLQSAETPEELEERFAIENFITQAVQTIPDLVLAEA